MLNLHRLTLKGFGCFKEEKVFEYEDGFNLFHCANGKGKTTSLQAIEMILLSNYQGSYSDYINNESDGFEISLEFDLDGYSLKEILACKKGKSVTSTRTLINLSTNEELANGEKVKDWLNEHLPTSTTKFALFARQNSDTDIINCGDSERRDIFKRIQDLDFSKEIKVLVDSKIDAVKQSIIDVDKEIFALENKTYEEKESLELPFAKDEYDVKKTELEKYIAEKSLSEEKIKEKENITNMISSLNDELERYEENIYTKKSTISDYTNTINNSDEEKKSIDDKCEFDVKAKNDYIEQMNYELAILDEEKENKKKEIEKNVGILNTNLDNITNSINSIKLVKIVKFDENKLNEAISKVSEKQTEIKINEKNIESLEEGICPICGSDCTHKVNEFKKLNGELKNELIKLEEIASEIKAEKLELDNKANRNLELKNTKIELENTRNKIQNNIDSLTKEKEMLDITFEQKKKHIEDKISFTEKEIESIKENCENSKLHIDEKVILYKETILTYTEELKQLQNEQKLKYDRMLELKEERDSIVIDVVDEEVINQISSRLNEYDSIVAQNKIIEKDNENLDKQKKDDKKLLDEFKEKRITFEKQRYDLESSKSIMMKDFPNWVIENSIQTMENNMNEFINDIYYKSLNISLRSTKTAIKLEYGKGENKLPCSRLSGAEKQLTNLSFINNFNKMLNLGVIILDEFDSACDTKRKQMLYESLINLKDVYKQIIVVTHSDEMSNYICANTETNIIEL